MLDLRLNGAVILLVCRIGVRRRNGCQQSDGGEDRRRLSQEFY
jgi:hypothetical protein